MVKVSRFHAQEAEHGRLDMFDDFQIVLEFCLEQYSFHQSQDLAGGTGRIAFRDQAFPVGVAESGFDILAHAVENFSRLLADGLVQGALFRTQRSEWAPTNFTGFLLFLLLILINRRRVLGETFERWRLR